MSPDLILSQYKNQTLVRNNLKNKMLHVVFTVVRNARPYDPNYPDVDYGSFYARLKLQKRKF